MSFLVHNNVISLCAWWWRRLKDKDWWGSCWNKPFWMNKCFHSTDYLIGLMIEILDSRRWMNEFCWIKWMKIHDRKHFSGAPSDVYEIEFSRKSHLRQCVDDGHNWKSRNYPKLGSSYIQPYGCWDLYLYIYVHWWLRIWGGCKAKHCINRGPLLKWLHSHPCHKLEYYYYFSNKVAITQSAT